MKTSENSEINSARKILGKIKSLVQSSRSKSSSEILEKTTKFINQQKLTNPISDNAVHYILHNVRKQGIERTKADILERIASATNHIENSRYKISDMGSQKIKKGMVVFTHGYSNHVLGVLLGAKDKGTRFEVYNTEAKPSEEGKLMAGNLSKHKIPISMFADLALRQAMKKADVVLLGAKVISENGQIYGRIGSELVAEVAEMYDVPVYVCADSWKFNQGFAKHQEKSVYKGSKLWPNHPKGVEIINLEFEKINPKLITGIITESGIYKPHYLISEIRKQCPWTTR